MAARATGAVIKVASAPWILLTPGQVGYGASKHGVLGYLKWVPRELHRSPTRISVIMPSVVDTELVASTDRGRQTTGARRRRRSCTAHAWAAPH
ncbi:SDR family NAD(P)-dependent oxidoreductase [Arthrobacter psychrolactophilus]